MKKQQNILFIYSRLSLSDATIEFMPFGMNMIKGLEKMNYNIYLYLSESKNLKYTSVFTKNVKIFFYDNRIIWGIVKYLRKYKFDLMELFIIECYYLLVILKTNVRYDMVFGMGVIGTSVAHKICRRKKIPFYYMNDELPNVNTNSIWKDLEKYGAQQADFIIIPDELRIEEIKRQVNNINNKKFFVLPNGPFIEDIQLNININWYEKLNIIRGKRLLLYAGGSDYYNRISDIISTVEYWPLDTVLYILALKPKKLDYLEPRLENRVIWDDKKLSDKEFYSLIKFSSICFGIYDTSVEYLEYAGKSSGKIMRSIACGTPVIASNVNSLKFVTEYGFGELISNNYEIPKALIKILNNLDLYRNNCKENYKYVSYDKYWHEFKNHLLTDY